jgi:putative acetyltransferase
VTAPVVVRPAGPEDLSALLEVHRRAFGSDVEADLVAALLADPEAAPLESFVAVVDGEVVAHVLLTDAQVASAPGLSARLLAPLAVVPEHQGRGLGTAVTVGALDAARAHGVVLVMVLGHPAYYPRFGFRPLLPRGPAPAYPVAPQNYDAWMTLELHPGATEVPTGPVRLPAPLMAPELWLP